MKMNLFVIPYSFKSMELTQEETLKLVSQIGFDGVEGGALTDEYLELLAKYNPVEAKKATAPSPKEDKPAKKPAAKKPAAKKATTKKA